MKKWILVLLPALLFIATACSKDEPYIPPTVDRTVLFYMMPDRRLDSDMFDNIEAMKLGAADGHLENGNLIVYINPSNDTPQLLQLKAGRDGKIQQFSVKDYSEHISTSEEVMKEVFQDVLTLFPAESYGLGLSSHGSAWLPVDYKEQVRSIGPGPDVIEIPVLKDILKNIMGSRKFEFILFDACTMASVEVAYELRDITKEIIASQTEIMSAGFPYTDVTKFMFTPEVMSEEICKSFHSYYENEQVPYGGSISLIRTANLEGLASITRTIIQQNLLLSTMLPLDKIQRCDYGPGLYSKPLLFDMKEYIDALSSDEQSNSFKEQLERVVPHAETTEKVYFSYGPFSGVNVAGRLNGLSIYVMQPKYPQLNNWYKQLDWYKAIYE